MLIQWEALDGMEDKLVPLAPSDIRSPMRALMGATPVPGPTQMTGVAVSSGSSI